MDKLIDTLENNRLLKQILGMKAIHNKPTDFIQGEEVVTLNPIDIWDTIKPGSVGFINTIMHRYKGRPAEHHEFWIISNGVKSRYETHQILKINIVREFIEGYRD